MFYENVGEKMIKKFKENIGFVSAIISIISASGAIFSGVKIGISGLILCIDALLISILIIYIFVLERQLNKAEGKIESLHTLAEEKRIHSINYILNFEILKQDKNRKKTRQPYIQNSEFKFYVHNVANVNMADVEYEHTFYLERHDGLFDPLILHSAGELIQKQTYCIYGGKKINAMQIPISQNSIENQNNLRVKHQYFYLNKQEYHPSRFRILLSYWFKRKGKNWLAAPCETLKLHYYNKEEHFMRDDDVFVIFPKNYGAMFSGKMEIKLIYDYAERPFSVQLQRLPYSTGSHKMEFVSGFQYNEDATVYTCEVDSLDIHSVYFVIIKR